MQDLLATRSGLAIAAALGVACAGCAGAITDPPRAAVAQAARLVTLAPALGATLPDRLRVTIAMTAGSADALAASGFELVAFKASGSWDRAGVPLVWLRTMRYSLTTVVTWQRQYQAYTATHEDVPSATIEASAAYDIAPGQVLEVRQPTGTGRVVLGGAPDAISIHNLTMTQFTCGISQRLGTRAATISAFPLYGTGLVAVVPLERVLLVFTTAPLDPGTPVQTSPGLGLLVDLGDTAARSVTYDINTGWSWGAEPWASEVLPAEDIVSRLIVVPPW